MSSSYRALLARAGARPLALACALGWLAFGGYNLALILLVHAQTGSFALAGGAVAAFAVGSGLGAPFRGRLIDRRGPRLLGVFAAGHAGAAALLIVCCSLGTGTVSTLAASALTGMLVPPLMATARAEWTRVAAESVATAYALTGALGDLGGLAGPALVGGLAASVSVVAAFAAEVGMASLAAVIVAVISRPGDAHPDDRDSAGRADRVRRSLIRYPGLRTLVLGDVGLGLALGSIEVSVPALCAHHGSASLAAVPLSISAVGSVLASLLSGTGRLRRSAAWRYVTGGWIAALVLTVLLAVRSVVGVTCVLAVTGAGVGLLSVALYELLDRVVPGERAVEAFTWLTSGQAAGLAAGSLIAGQLSGHRIGAAFAFTAVTALVSAVTVTVRRRTLREPTPSRS
jgi:MFS family permease